MIKQKRTILIDLDGVLNYYNGNFDEKFIPPVRKDALGFIQNLYKKFDIKLFTTRNKLLASKWVLDNGLEEYISDVTNIKEPAWMYVDDRCINFDGDFETLTNKINDFEPWHKAKFL